MIFLSLQKEKTSAHHVSIIGEVSPERIPWSAALEDEMLHPVPDEVGFTRVRHVIPVADLRSEHGIGQAAIAPTPAMY